MDIWYDYKMVSPSGYKFRCSYALRKNDKDVPKAGTLYVGKPKKDDLNEACTTIAVNYPNILMADGRSLPIDPTVASLILTKYYGSCAEGLNLPKGKGTKEMIVSSLSLIKRLCPFVKEFDLMDASSKECDRGGSISLPYFYITQKWQTWYEGIFRAYLKPASLYQEYRDALIKMKESGLEQYADFRSRYLFGQSDSVKEAIKTSYEKSKTVGEFFKHLYEDQLVSMTCVLLQPWINKYMKDMKMDMYILHQKWYISVDTIPTYGFQNTNKTLKKNQRTNNGSQKRRDVWYSPKKLNTIK